MKKELWLIISLALIIVALAAVILWPAKAPTSSQQQNQQTTLASIEIFSPQPDQEVASPLKITGVVRGDGWGGFEGQVGSVKLLDYKGNQLAEAPLTATTEWTSLPTSFETTLNFTAANSGPATLMFHNENPSGDPARDRIFSLPVKVK